MGVKLVFILVSLLYPVSVFVTSIAGTTVALTVSDHVCLAENLARKEASIFFPHSKLYPIGAQPGSCRVVVIAVVVAIVGRTSTVSNSGGDVANYVSGEKNPARL